MKYRGFTIDQEYDLQYYAVDEKDYDADWDGEQYVQCGGMPTQGGCKTIDELKAEIDYYHYEQGFHELTSK